MMTERTPTQQDTGSCASRSLSRLSLKALFTLTFMLIFTLTLNSVGVAKPVELSELREEARVAYKKKQFKRAQQLMTRAVQAHPTSSNDYLMLARSAYANHDHARATVAYKLYFELSRNPEKRAQSEFASVKEKVKGKRAARYEEGCLERVKHVEGLAKRGELKGKGGALAQLNRMKRERLFHPRLKRAYKAVREALNQRHEVLLGRWWGGEPRVSRAELIELSGLWATWGEGLGGSEEEAVRQRSLLLALIDLDERPEEAYKRLTEDPQALNGSSEARYALLVALFKTARHKEALALTRALITQAPQDRVTRLRLIEAELLSALAQTPSVASLPEPLEASELMGLVEFLSQP
jgi:thioredoxin-like negative regulator of GroEL